MKDPHLVNFKLALSILEKLLEGKKQKQVAFEENISVQRVSYVKRMFPLFLGLPRKYGDKAD